jgi:hypothetical protein
MPMICLAEPLGALAAREHWVVGALAEPWQLLEAVAALGRVEPRRELATFRAINAC